MKFVRYIEKITFPNCEWVNADMILKQFEQQNLHHCHAFVPQEQYGEAPVLHAALQDKSKLGGVPLLSVCKTILTLVPSDPYTMQMLHQMLQQRLLQITQSGKEGKLEIIDMFLACKTIEQLSSLGYRDLNVPLGMMCSAVISVVNRIKGKYPNFLVTELVRSDLDNFYAAKKCFECVRNLKPDCEEARAGCKMLNDALDNWCELGLEHIARCLRTNPNRDDAVSKLAILKEHFVSLGKYHHGLSAIEKYAKFAPEENNDNMCAILDVIEVASGCNEYIYGWFDVLVKCALSKDDALVNLLQRATHVLEQGNLKAARVFFEAAHCEANVNSEIYYKIMNGLFCTAQQLYAKAKEEWLPIPEKELIYNQVVSILSKVAKYPLLQKENAKLLSIVTQECISLKKYDLAQKSCSICFGHGDLLPFEDIIPIIDSCMDLSQKLPPGGSCKEQRCLRYEKIAFLANVASKYPEHMISILDQLFPVSLAAGCVYFYCALGKVLIAGGSHAERYVEEVLLKLPKFLDVATGHLLCIATNYPRIESAKALKYLDLVQKYTTQPKTRDAARDAAAKLMNAASEKQQEDYKDNSYNSYKLQQTDNDEEPQGEREVHLLGCNEDDCP